MKDKRLHTPDGVKDFLPKDLFIKKNIEILIDNIFKKYGYLSISSPTFEYIDVFDRMGSYSQNQIFKFLDKDGNTLALRSDMTPAIARIVGSSYTEDNFPIRLSYIENSFRESQSFQGKLKEFTQAGIELIGEKSDEATAEVIAVAVKSILATGLDDFRIDIGSVDFFKAIMEDTGLSNSDFITIQNYILDKDFVSAEKMITNSNNLEVVALFKELSFLVGGSEVLEKVRKLTNNKKALEAIDQLENIFNILKLYNLDNYILYDLSMIGQLDYYTGIIFRGYTYGTSSYLLDGGRYDKLLANFGRDCPAVGFAIKIDTLLKALTSTTDLTSNFIIADTLVAYDDLGKKNAISYSNELRETGVSIETSFIIGDLEKNIEFAKKRNIKGILYFKNETDVEIIDIDKNERNSVKLSDLKN